MATTTSAPIETMADLLAKLNIPPERILLRPSPGEATEEDALKSRRLCELIDAVLVEKAMGYYESSLAAVLIGMLHQFLKQHAVGVVLDGTGMVRVEPEQLRMPDVSFISWKHFPNRLLPKGQILDVVPDLAVEILSPTNTKKEMARKRNEYFAGGAKLVWEVHPAKRLVKVFTAPQEETTVAESGILDGGTVLPGFTVLVREWFESAGKREE